MSGAKSGRESHPALHAALRARFGLESFRAGQREVIERLLAGQRTLALLPTGAGKSLCYQLPALLLEGVTVVVSPLIALMQDQVAALQARGIAAARFDPGAGKEAAGAVIEAVREGRLRLLFVAPESLTRGEWLECLREQPPALLAIDEAHCISEWGHQFRPDYLRLGEVARRLRPRALLALTATACPEAVRDLRRWFRIAAGDVVRTTFRRPNLALRVTPCAEEERDALLLNRLQKLPAPALVYVTRQQTAAAVTGMLRRAGIPARAYHAGMTMADRAEVQRAFMNNEAAVIVATIAFGMGIDKADIRAVYHYNLPKSLENYQQETGRAGRDGAPAHCEVFACEGDVTELESLVLGAAPSSRALDALVDHLLRRGERVDFSIVEWSAALDLRVEVIETVLTQMELEGLLRPDGGFHAAARFRLLQEEERMLAGRGARERARIRALLDRSRKDGRWLRVDRVDADEERLLCELREAGEIEWRACGQRRRYRLTAKGLRCAPVEIAERMKELFSTQEENALKRLRGVVHFVTDRGCLTRHLLGYFGERFAGRCGTCESCLQPGRKARVLPPRAGRSWTTEDIEVMQMLVRERHPALRGARQLARFLCGMSSPAAARARLHRRDEYGCLRELGFREVLAQAEALAGVEG